MCNIVTACIGATLHQGNRNDSGHNPDMSSNAGAKHLDKEQRQATLSAIRLPLFSYMLAE